MFSILASVAEAVTATVTPAAEAAVEATAAPAATAAPTYLQTAFKKLVNLPATLWIAVGVLLALGIGLYVISRNKKQWTTKMLSYAALSIALSFVLSCIRLYRMPQGGSVTPASMLPVMLFSACYGVGPGLLVGAVYGLLQFLQDAYFMNVWEFLLDYIIAFGALGLAGLAKHINLKNNLGVYIAIVIAVFGRAVSAILAGYMFWDTGTIWASVVYNGTYLLPEVAICLVLAVMIAPRVMKQMRT